MEKAKKNKNAAQKIRVAIATGGDSSEYVISVQSADEIKKNLNREKYEVYTVMFKDAEWFVTDADTCELVLDKNDFSFVLNGQKIKFDVVFIALHGTPGEDGKLQGYFDLLKIPYTSCDRLTSSLTFNKYFTTGYLKSKQIKSAVSVLLRSPDQMTATEIISQVSLPCFVKPNNGGSSFGISKVMSTDELYPALQKAFKEDTEVIVERFIEGTELTCGIFKSRNEAYIFPLTEIVSHNEFFDFEAKYEGKSDEITPARITGKQTKACQDLASRIYDLLNCKGVVRIDFIMRNDKFYFLEVNTIPGMTRESIVPQQVREYGMTMQTLYELIIQDALERNQ